MGRILGAQDHRLEVEFAELPLDTKRQILEGDNHTCKMAKYFLPSAKSVLHRLSGNLTSPGNDGIVAALDAKY
jgi:hypothetical protein